MSREMTEFDYFRSIALNVHVCILGDSEFFRHQGVVKATVSGVFQDLDTKLGETPNVYKSPSTIEFKVWHPT